jgi:hypothetical protein
MTQPKSAAKRRKTVATAEGGCCSTSFAQRRRERPPRRLPLMLRPIGLALRGRHLPLFKGENALIPLTKGREPQQPRRPWLPSFAAPRLSLGAHHEHVRSVLHA